MGPTNKSQDLVDRCIWHTTIDDEDYAIPLQELLSKWTQSELIPLLEMEFDQFCGAGKTIRLNELVLDIGKVAFDNLARDLPGLIKSKLKNKLFYITENNSLDAIKDSFDPIMEVPNNKELFDWIMTNGTAPWWYKTKQSIQDLIESHLIHNSEFINDVIAEISRNSVTRKRILWQWGEPGCKRLVEKLQPNYSDEIYRLIKEIHIINRKLRVASLDNAMFLGGLWQMAIEYLLCTQGIPFSIQILSNFIFGKLSDDYGHNHDVLVHRFLDETSSPYIKNILSNSYLDKLPVQHFLTYSQLYLSNVSNSQEGYWALLVGLLRSRRTEGAIKSKFSTINNTLKIQDVVSILAEDNKKKLVQLLRKVGREDSLRRHLVTHLDDIHKIKLIQILAPNDHGFIQVHAHRTQLLLIGEKKDESIVWDVIFAYLLVDSGSYFNRVMFVKNTISKIARERNLEYASMLQWLLGSAMENIGFENRFELIGILGDLKKEEESQEKNNRSIKIKYLDVLHEYLVDGVWPIEISKADFNFLDIRRLIIENNSTLGGVIDRAVEASRSKSKDKVFTRILNLCKQSQVENLMAELSFHNGRVLTNTIMQIQLWQKHLCLLNLRNTDLHFNLYSIALEIAYENRGSAASNENMISKLLHALFLTVHAPIAILIDEVEVCINRNINIILSEQELGVLSNALNSLNSGLLKNTNKNALNLPLMQDVGDWSLARKVSTVYRILQNQYVGGYQDDSGKDSMKIVLDNLSVGECHKIFDGLLKQSTQFKSITGLIAHFDEPKVNSWLKTLWPSATEQMNGLVQQWQDEILNKSLWAGTSSILRRKLEKIYWSCVIEKKLNNSRDFLNRSLHIISIGHIFNNKELEQLYLNLIYISCHKLAIPIPESIRPAALTFNLKENNKTQSIAKLTIDDNGLYLQNPLFPEIFQSLLVNGRFPIWLSNQYSLPINKIISDLLRFQSDKFRHWIKYVLDNRNAMFRLNSAIVCSELLKAIATDRAANSDVLLSIEALFLGMVSCGPNSGLSQEVLNEVKANLINSLMVKWVEEDWQHFGPQWPVQYLLTNKEIASEELTETLWLHRHAMPTVFLKEIEMIHHDKSTTNIPHDVNKELVTVPEIDFYSNAKILQEPGIQGEPLSINNAGVVILHSFFKMYFTKLKLLNENDEGSFANEISQRKAVHCLQFLVSGEVETEEQHLVFNKLLCGLALSNPIERVVELEADEVDIANSLIEAMINYWPAIGGSSIEGFRGNWLVRNGTLTELDDRWELVVERKSYDILLQQAPFSYSIINYPWMNKPIYVTWPT